MTVPTRVIGVDIDNVVTSTDEVIRDLIFRTYGISSKQDDILTWRYCDSLPITEGQEKEIFDQFHRHHCSSLSPVAGAAETLQRLSADFSIILLTNRPDFTRQATCLWLEEHAIPFHRLILSEKKLNFAPLLSALLEDRGETALEFAGFGLPVYLFDYPWNKGFRHKLITRVSGWTGFQQHFYKQSPV